MEESNKKIKLCYVLPDFDLETDTHFFYLYSLINEVSQELDISLIIEKSNSDISFFKGIESVYIQKFTWLPLRFLENFLLVLWNRIRGYNNFYIHYSYISTFNASLVSKLTRARVFYWNCGMMWLFGRDKFLQTVLRMINFLVTGVDALKEGYNQNYNINLNKIKIMPNWIDLKRFQNTDQNFIYEKYGLDGNKVYILFVHRLAKRKGAHYIVPVANALQDLNIEFLVAGDGPYEDILKQEIEDNKLENIKLLGRVPNKEVSALMRVSKLFFMPSEEEGFPRVLLEAMASGLPYVVSDIGGVREISIEEQQEFIFDIGDVKSMSGSIRKLLEDQSLYRKLKEINLEHVKQFDIQKVSKIFISLFK
jgi:glycosyltransferase involved in cell wall biosynthesis